MLLTSSFSSQFDDAVPTDPRGGGIFEKETIWESLYPAFLAFSQRPFLGWRTSVDNFLAPHLFDFTKPLNNSKKEKNLNFSNNQRPGQTSQFSWMTYSQTLKLIEYLGSGLDSLFPGRTFGCISGINRPEWVISDFACCRQNYVSVPIDVKMDNGAVKHILKSTKAVFVICSVDLLDKYSNCITELKQANEPTYLTHLICFENEIPQSSRDLMKKANLICTTLTELVIMGNKKQVPPNPQNPEELYTLCYTSGSTGMTNSKIVCAHCVNFFSKTRPSQRSNVQ